MSEVMTRSRFFITAAVSRRRHPAGRPGRSRGSSATSQLFAPEPFCRLSRWTPGTSARGANWSEGDGAEAIQLILGIALPGDADLETADGAELAGAKVPSIGLGEQVGDIGRHRRQGGPEEPRQAQQGDVEVELGEGVSLGHQPPRCRSCRPGAHQRRLARHDHPAAALLHQGGVPEELEGIAQPLLGVDQDGPPVQGGAVPGGPGGTGNVKFLALPTPFITRAIPCSPPIWSRASDRFHLRLGIVGLEVDGLLIARHGLVEPTLSSTARSQGCCGHRGSRA